MDAVLVISQQVLEAPAGRRAPGGHCWIVNRPGNAPSSQDAARYRDQTSEAILEVSEQVLMRGDTDFSQTKHLDGWHESKRRDFVFGFDACPGSWSWRCAEFHFKGHICFASSLSNPISSTG